MRFIFVSVMAFLSLLLFSACSGSESDIVKDPGIADDVLSDETLQPAKTDPDQDKSPSDDPEVVDEEATDSTEESTHPKGFFMTEGVKAPAEICPKSEQRTFYKDQDGDGYGDVNQSIVACATPTDGSYVKNHNDCDDGNANINPLMVDGLWLEYPLDGVDNNCNGYVDEYKDHYRCQLFASHKAGDPQGRRSPGLSTIRDFPGVKVVRDGQTGAEKLRVNPKEFYSDANFKNLKTLDTFDCVKTDVPTDSSEPQDVSIWSGFLIWTGIREMTWENAAGSKELHSFGNYLSSTTLTEGVSPDTVSIDAKLFTNMSHTKGQKSSGFEYQTGYHFFKYKTDHATHISIENFQLRKIGGNVNESTNLSLGEQDECINVLDYAISDSHRSAFEKYSHKLVFINGIDLAYESTKTELGKLLIETFYVKDNNYDSVCIMAGFFGETKEFDFTAQANLIVFAYDPSKYDVKKVSWADFGDETYYLPGEYVASREFSLNDWVYEEKSFVVGFDGWGFNPFELRYVHGGKKDDAFKVNTVSSQVDYYFRDDEQTADIRVRGGAYKNKYQENKRTRPGNETSMQLLYCWKGICEGSEHLTPSLLCPEGDQGCKIKIEH